MKDNSTTSYPARRLGFLGFGTLLLSFCFLGGCNSEAGKNNQLDAENQYLPNGQMVLTTESDSAFEALEDLDHGDRENWQKPQMVISRLGDLSDKVVADIGAGTGYF
ncbi:MAG: hypothetical protein IPN95_31580 [Bacteroidetes bacterium]|nr:hypothetical protein [Bacteroidota bacterium]